MLDKAVATLETATSVAASDPDSAFVLTYDAARHALVALLLQQGLRPTQKGGHVVVEQAARAQFGAGFKDFGGLRRRRNELEYPEYPDERAMADEVSIALEQAKNAINSAQRLIGDLSFF